MVRSINTGSAGYDAFEIQLARTQAADRILRATDSNKDGRITEEELSRSMEAQGNQQGPSAAELFKQLDQGDKGYITRQDLEAGLAKVAQGQQTQGPPRREAGGGGGGGAGTVTSFDVEDLNQDGNVTMQEKVQYALKMYAAQKEAQSSKPASVYG